MKTLGNPSAARGGFALAAALLALVVVGAVVTGTFYVATEEGASGRASVRGDDALFVAEQGLNHAIGTVTKSTLDGLADRQVWPTTPSAVTISGPNGAAIGRYLVQYRKLGNLTLVVSTGAAARGPTGERGNRTVAMLVRTLSMTLPDGRAITSYATTHLQGNATIDGRDAYPTEWNGEGCTDMGTQNSVIAAESPALVKSGSSQYYGTYTTDSNINASTFSQFGDLDWNTLTAAANIVLPPGASVTNPNPVSSSGVCNTAIATNWGAPENHTDPCFDYFPIIYAQGDVHISSSASGQGMLLVEGDLTIDGGFKFYGIVITHGLIDASGGAQITGQVMSYNGGTFDSDNTNSGTSLVQYSSCARRRALENLSLLMHPVPLSQRPWVDVTAAGATLDFGTGSLNTVN